MPSRGPADYHGNNFKRKICLDCPAVIPAYGKKLRCAPCGDLHYQAMKRARDKARRAQAKMLKAAE